MVAASTFDLSGVHDEHALKASVPPPLAELCVTAIAANFVNRPTLRGIPARYIDRVTELLPAQMALEVTGPLIDDEGYWKRSALARWDNCQISSHGSSWKRLYFERNLEDFLEAFDPLKQDTEELTRLLAVSKDYIFSLHLKQFLSHLDLEMVFQNVPTLCHLDMTYGVKEIGMDYERSLFGMKLNDVASLAKALRVTETLTILSLPCNLLDDSTVRVLATGLQDNVTITSIDLSHNKIADRGVKALAKLLNERSVVLSLNLNDNHIHADGGKYFGRALKLNRCAGSPLPLRPALRPTSSPLVLRPYFAARCRTSTSGSTGWATRAASSSSRACWRTRRSRSSTSRATHWSSTRRRRRARSSPPRRRCATSTSRATC